MGIGDNRNGEEARGLHDFSILGQHAALSESNYARGEEAVRKYLGYKPAHDEPALARAWYWLGMIQEKEGKKADARQSYTNAQKLTPDAKDINEALKRVS